MSVWRAREAKNSATYRSARWATRDEIKAEGMVGPDGVVLGIFAEVTHLHWHVFRSTALAHLCPEPIDEVGSASKVDMHLRC